MSNTSFTAKDFENDFCLLGVESDQAYVGFGPFETSSEPDPVRPSFFIQDFYLSNSESWHTPRECKLIPLKLLKEISSEVPKAKFSQPSKDLYRDTFNNLLNQIAAGTLEKAVPVIFETGELTSGNAISLLPALARLPGFLNPFAFRKGSQLVIGLSPEILFRKEQESNLLISEAVAGTTLSSNSERLLDDPHLKREHSVVITDIQEQLSQFGRCRVSTISLQPYPGLMHLRAEVAVEIGSEVTPTQLISSLHPTGALGVLPRAEADLNALRQLDPQNCRGVYGAPFGIVLPNGYWKVVVLIRSLILNEGQILLGSGGGIIASSELEREWSELKDKRESVKRMFFI